MGNMQDENLKYRILGAEFETSVFEVFKLLKTEKPEVAFVGRSNVGKSSLINALCNRHGMARTSRTPGRTQSFNYYQVKFCIDALKSEEIAERRFSAYLVDLPGFGYAEAPKHLSGKWPLLIEQYLLKREQLSGLLLLVDCRREPGEEEIWLAEHGMGGNFRVVITKADKLGHNELEKGKRMIKEKLGIDDSHLIVTSSDKKHGIEPLRDLVCSWLVN